MGYAGVVQTQDFDTYATLDALEDVFAANGYKIHRTAGTLSVEKRSIFWGYSIAVSIKDKGETREGLISYSAQASSPKFRKVYDLIAIAEEYSPKPKARAKHFCPGCGAELKSTDKFCPSCGTRIK